MNARMFLRSLMICFFAIWCLTLSVSLAPCPANAGSRAFEALKSDYLLLRNRDPRVEEPLRWRVLAHRLQVAAVGRALPESERDQVLYMAGTLYGEVMRRSIRDGGATDVSAARDALAALRDVSGRGGEYADDALARAEEIYRDLKREAAARQVGKELQQRFVGSEFSALMSDRDRNESVTQPLKSGSGGEAQSRRVDVVLDPGHGGDDLGAQGYAGLLEKDVTLAVALSAQRALERKGISVGLTRIGDQFLPLSSRTKLANQRDAKVFISIHANASVRGTNRGIETYILDGDQGGNTKLLVKRENGSEASDLAFLVGELIQREKMPEAKRLATVVQQQMVRQLRDAGFAPVDLGVKRGPFFVLVGSHMPSILIEIGYIDHAEEGRQIGSEPYRDAIAQAIASGVAQYLQGSGHE